jgi:hypothetical protein
MAPALVALMALVDRRPSSSMASSTPQVKAPCAPPPCRASETGRGEADRLRVDGEEADPVIAISPSSRHPRDGVAVHIRPVITDQVEQRAHQLRHR